MSLDPVQILLEKDAIQNIKHEYFRRLDSKQFDDLIKLFTEDATTAYDTGRHSCYGREAIFNFLDESMSMHILCVWRLFLRSGDIISIQI